jgi:ATP-dependent exoDNAse (exonuclease V) beta subunit
LSEKRTLAETRRLFYVATTRAKESLTLSGVGSLPKDDKEDDFKTPLSSLLKIMKPDEENFTWLVDPLPSPPVKIEERSIPFYEVLPPFDAEPLPYQARSPSRIEDETSQASPLGWEEEEGYARARGVVIHRILETLARKQSCPESGAIAVALEREGIPFQEAGEMAPQVLEEALQAWDAADFLSLRKSARELHVEWAVEDYDGRRTVRVGRFDMLLKMEDRWLLLDYKTGRPEQDIEAWLKIRKQHYRPQLDAYAEMVARGLAVPKEKIEWAILFTALPRLVWQENSGRRNCVQI